MGDKSVRLFWAATIPEETKREIAKLQTMLLPRFYQARFEGEPKLHITLNFIGDFRKDMLEDLISSFEVLKKEFPRGSPATSVTGASYFPSERSRRGIWLDCEDDGTLASVASALGNLSGRFGKTPEARDFRAHIAIARFRESHDARADRTYPRRSAGADSAISDADLKKIVAETKLATERFSPRSVALFESTLKPSGSEYRILYEYFLELAGEDSLRAGPVDRKGR